MIKINRQNNPLIHMTFVIVIKVPFRTGKFLLSRSVGILMKKFIKLRLNF